ncbi:HAUS augmin-like complex subunit 3 [Dendronephthya gigantea]|uniref:HAUS augmin-like complex subunit 3 n=1 Tax=Dendronephthya gigantea TaxID=151771 RepID=UPI00106B233E|nr:HAUS augmin-like complex subunit 3 [Dendronephthya gigantea]XP_028391501.1 HAUS augmin-like complex subunit 3 [Dendronephthya gigantea]
MSGIRFVDALKRIGYGSKLSAESFDWMFESEDTLPFLEWFCDSVHAQNVITDEELKGFEELTISGKGILEGENLMEALKNLQALETNESSEEEVREETQFLMEEKQILEERLDALIKQRNKMNIMSTAFNHKLTKMNALENDAKAKYKTSLEQAYSDNAMLNKSMEDLTKTVTEFTQMYDLPAAPMEKETATFVSQLSLDDYHKAEEGFTSELTKYTKKQFFEGIAELANGSEKSRYTFLEISDPATLLIKGEAEDVTTGDIKELKRLKAIYPMSEIKRIQAQAKNHGLNAAITHSRGKLYRLTNQPHTSDISTLRQLLQEYQHKLTQTRDRTAELTSRYLSPLVQELGKLQANKILRGDYDLKIARQDYFVSKQDQVINQLMLQRSRYEFLSMLLEVEARKHRDSHHLLGAVRTLLEGDADMVGRRYEVMSNPLLRDDKKRDTIDVRDLFLTRLYKLLDEPDELTKRSSIFITYDGLRKKAEDLKNNEVNMKNELAAVDSSQNESIEHLERSLREYKQMVYGNSATSGGLPQLQTQVLSDGINQLSEVLATLENSIMDVKKDCESKKRVLSADSLNLMERELFVLFFTDPQRLKRTMSDLAARVEAQIVSAD